MAHAFAPEQVADDGHRIGSRPEYGRRRLKRNSPDRHQVFGGRPARVTKTSSLLASAPPPRARVHLSGRKRGTSGVELAEAALAHLAGRGGS